MFFFRSILNIQCGSNYFGMRAVENQIGDSMWRSWIWHEGAIYNFYLFSFLSIARYFHEFHVFNPEVFLIFSVGLIILECVQ